MNLDETKLAIEPYVNKLAAFQDADDIAEFLAGENVRAVQADGRSCAIARYIRRESGADISVGGNGVNGYENKDRFPVQLSRHTPVMRQFVDRFDGGRYPQLIDTGDTDTRDTTDA